MQISIEMREGQLVPVAAGRPLAEIVGILHEKTVDDGIVALNLPGIDRTTLEPLLTYCAERRCIADHASCIGCKRRTEVQGLSTLDAFVDAHRAIVIEGAGLTLTGHGNNTLAVDSLDTLVRTWPGEEIWFYARRVIRKLRYGTRSKDDPRPVAPGRQPKPAVILVEPQLAENVGMVARAMANFGLAELRLVAPRDGWPNERARIAASGATFVVDDAVPHATLEHAVADLNYVIATTARQRDLAKPVFTPDQAIAEIRRRIADGQHCGILFGRERNGLESSEVANADAIVMVPVDPKFASLKSGAVRSGPRLRVDEADR